MNNKKLNIKDIVLTSLFTALTAIGALSQILYMIIGLIGLPVFAGFTGGVQTIFKPSFGFIIGFIFASYISGKVFYSFKNKSIRNLFVSSFIGTMVIYIFGLPYMYYILNIMMNSNLSLNYILTAGFLIFLPGDILKIIIATFIGNKILYLTHQKIR